MTINLFTIASAVDYFVFNDGNFFISRWSNLLKKAAIYGGEKVGLKSHKEIYHFSSEVKVYNNNNKKAKMVYLPICMLYFRSKSHILL
jgi:hypothetical protein